MTFKLKIGFVFLLLLFSCNEDLVQSVLVSQNEQDNVANADSLVDCYTQSFHDYYDSVNADFEGITLQLSGKKRFENDSMLILSFDEILEFGSWHYSNSSLCFSIKEKDLIPITAISGENGLLKEYYGRRMDFPNRIEGELFQVVDLTGDGRAEYIFHARSSIRTNFEERYSFYHLNSESNRLVPYDLIVTGHGVEGDCDRAFGDLCEIEIIEGATQAQIEIKQIKCTCNDELLKVEEISRATSYYVWDKALNQFKKQIE